MVFAWFSVLIFPGWLFILATILGIEQITTKFKYSLLKETNNKPIFILPIEQIKSCKKIEDKKQLPKIVAQLIIIFVNIIVVLIGTLFLPINLKGRLLESPFKEFSSNTKEIVIGPLSFNGDIIVLMIILLISDLLIILAYSLNNNKFQQIEKKNSFIFIAIDLPLLLIIFCAVLPTGALSLAEISSNFRFIAYFNQVFSGLFLLPCGIILAFSVLVLKYNLPYFSSFIETKQPVIASPVSNDWRYPIWDFLIRAQEFFVAALIVSIFTGGSTFPIPVIEQFACLARTMNFLVKIIIIIVAASLCRLWLPRLNFKTSMDYLVKIALPISLAAIIIMVIFTQSGLLSLPTV
jgi:NADH:ubiquinone oxidoreductase subunit H